MRDRELKLICWFLYQIYNEVKRPAVNYKRFSQMFEEAKDESGYY